MDSQNAISRQISGGGLGMVGLFGEQPNLGMTFFDWFETLLPVNGGGTRA